MMSVSIIFRVTNDKRIFKAIKSLENQDYKEIIVVQNGTDRWHKMEIFCKENDIKFVYFEEGNASKAYNEGVKVASGDIVVCCDSDVHFSENFIDDVKKYTKNGYITQGILAFDEFGEVTVATNQACFLYKSDYEQIGGHDETFAKPNATDVAFCLRARQKGIKSRIIPQAVYYHPPTAQKRGLKVGMAEARANKKYPEYQKTWRMIGWDVLEVWRAIRHMIGLVIGGIV